MAFKFISVQKLTTLVLALFSIYQLTNSSVMVSKLNGTDCSGVMFLPVLEILAAGFALIYCILTIIPSGAKAATIRTGLFYVCLLVRCLSMLLASIYAG